MNQHFGSGRIQTVLGLVDRDQAGLTLTHEHLLSDFRCLAPRAEWDTDKGRNLVKSDVDALIREVTEFKKAGGGTIVDVTPLPNPGRNPEGLARVAREAGVNIVMGVAYYTEPFYTPDMDVDRKTAQEIAEEYLHEIANGVRDTGVKPGIIGEAGCSWPLSASMPQQLPRLRPGFASAFTPDLVLIRRCRL
jgi:phosphotriesterase-related protein